MSRLEDLLAEHCPDGVEFMRLKDVARIRNGKDYKNFGDGVVPVYGTGGVMAMVDTSVYDLPSVLIPRKGSLDKLYFVDVPFWTVDTIFYTEIFDHMVPRFLYYFLQTQRLEELNQAGGIPSLTQSVLNELKIPVPPVEVQREIVRVLDLLSLLRTELEMEFEARRRQYGHYRDSLVTPTQQESVRWAEMGEVGEFIRGRRFTKGDVVPVGLASIHYGEIYTHYGVSATSALSHVRPELKPALRFAKTGDVVIASVGETVEDVCKAVAWLGEEEVAFHDDCFAYRHTLHPKFVAYFFQTSAFHAQKNKYVARAKVKRISGESLAKIKIPVPPMQEQERIVAILDKFDALVSDISVGLPAEIGARRRQYEFYRDRLLTFEEKAQ